MSALVKFEDVCKRYGDAIALYPTNLSIESGKTTVLIGPSGCGKSTLLRLIIRLIEPDSGSIAFDGKAVTPDNINALRRRIGYVIQEGGLFPHLTARANVLLMARHIRKLEEQTHNRLLELSELTRFSQNLLPRYPVELSGGQRQRVSLMRALMLSPELLLLDEPLGALDPLVRVSLQKDLKEIFTRLGQTVVFVTHDLAEAIYFADAIVLMNEGRIVQKGTITDLRERPADPFVSEFINAKRTLTDAGIPAEHRQGMGGTIILWEALRGGQIDAYPEYTGTIATEILKSDSTLSLDQIRNSLEKVGVGMTAPLGFNNTYALVMRRSEAQRLGIRTISNLQRYPELKFGLTHEFIERQDGWRPLRQRYRLPQQNIIGIDHALGYSALANGSVAVKDAYSTDAKIEQNDLFVLEDDLHFFPKYEAVLLFRSSTRADVIAAMRRLEGMLDETRMIRLNAEAERTKNYARAANLYFNVGAALAPRP